MSRPSRATRFARGERISSPPSAIDSALTSLWREAADNDEDDEATQATTRACLWNVAVQLEHRYGRDNQSEEIIRYIRELPQHLATRSVLIECNETREDGPDVESWLSANCPVGAAESRGVCSEEVVLSAYGLGEAHLPSLLHSSLLPDVPSAALFAFVESSPVQSSLKAVCDRIVTDVRWADDLSLHELRRLGRRARLGSIDLEWLALTRLRQAVAELFEPPATNEHWQSITRIQIESRNAYLPLMLMVGWLGSCLGAHRQDIAPGGFRARTGVGGELAIEVSNGKHEGISSITLSGGRYTASVERQEDRTWVINPSEASARRVQIDPIGRAGLLAQALRTRLHDQAYQDALRFSAELED